MQNTQFEYFKIEADESDETPKFKRHSMAIMYQTRCVKRKIMLSNAGFENKWAHLVRYLLNPRSLNKSYEINQAFQTSFS